MRAALSADMLATDLAEYLVRKGVPFRETHHISGAAVKMAEDRGVSLHELKPEDFKSLHASFEDDVSKIWSYETSIDNRTAIGGTSKPAVLDQIQKLQGWLAEGKRI